ncbi:hypothetical protein [Salinicola rhizosphaerae]|uniref:Uncharacterized protein n=1 Tax=Salinicola rhizosphaerae TaxID=1443141 RepID=A0ABQ3ECG5_9GAMM|nr:hypothetical protein [Salinicola rhizosphaerae]GHB30412.1 hypothetical protein GCM10009038_31490 [Salinicola rhizosphaerae]
MTVEVDENLKPSENSPGWVSGWGVLTPSPWNLKGVYANEEKARASAESGMKVVWGDHKPGTDDFVYSDSDQPG